MNKYEILECFDPSWMNNARSIASSYMDKFMENHSHYYEMKLNSIGIGVNWSIEGGDDFAKPESFFMFDERPMERIDDYQLGELLK